jgi:hypothetical protein
MRDYELDPASLPRTSAEIIESLKKSKLNIKAAEFCPSTMSRKSTNISESSFTSINELRNGLEMANKTFK